jgi:hypothetical protein
MSGTRNANITLVEVTSEDTVGVRKATQVLAVALLAALFAVPAASAAIRPPGQPVQSKQAVHALVIRGEALNRTYHLGSFARTSTHSTAKASTVLRPTAVKIAANPTGGSENKVQHVFSIH